MGRARIAATIVVTMGTDECQVVIQRDAGAEAVALGAVGGGQLGSLYPTAPRACEYIHRTGVIALVIMLIGPNEGSVIVH